MARPLRRHERFEGPTVAARRYSGFSRKGNGPILNRPSVLSRNLAIRTLLAFHTGEISRDKPRSPNKFCSKNHSALEHAHLQRLAIYRRSPKRRRDKFFPVRQVDLVLR